MRKGRGLSINTIIIVAIALIVVICLIAMFSDLIWKEKFNPALHDCLITCEQACENQSGCEFFFDCSKLPNFEKNCVPDKECNCYATDNCFEWVDKEYEILPACIYVNNTPYTNILNFNCSGIMQKVTISRGRGCVVE